MVEPTWVLFKKFVFQISFIYYVILYSTTFQEELLY